MADYYSSKEAELQRIKNNENEKNQGKKAKIISYLESYVFETSMELTNCCKYIKILWVNKTIAKRFCYFEIAFLKYV